MAHHLKIGGLSDELISSLTTYSTKDDPHRFNAYRESALRTLRYQNYPRTDQFEVQHNLEGLEEKFRVYLKDDLADALHDRVAELIRHSLKWTPEILYLLLELSDKPATKSKLENLKCLKEPEVVAPPLKWKDLVAEDPLLQDKNIWRNIDYAADSSDDGEEFLDSDVELSDLTETTIQSSIADENRQAINFAIPINQDDLEKLQASQFWQPRPPDYTVANILDTDVRITELQAIRETLFMLSGLPTSLFSVEHGETISVRPKAGYAMAHLSVDMFYSLLSEFARHGADIMELRAWTISYQSVPLMQSLQEAVGQRLKSLEEVLSSVQRIFVSPKGDIVVSLIEIRSHLDPYIRPIVRLSHLIKSLFNESNPPPFRFIEHLYDEVCVTQMAGDERGFRFMGTLFFECFQRYLQLVRLWMEHGELMERDTVFFVRRSAESIELPSLWQDRFVLRKTTEEILYAPNFLHLVSQKIFTTGKSVVVLKYLGKYRNTKAKSRQIDLDFNSVCNNSSIVPFSQMFDDNLERWLHDRHESTSSQLRQCLLEDCGLRKSLNAFHHLYFMVNGSTSGLLVSGLFNKLDSGKSNWNDRFTLSELVQSTIGELQDITAENLRAVVVETVHKAQRNARQSVKSLDSINFVYAIPWPVQLILTQDTTKVYQKVFTFLLQIRRASSLIESVRMLHDVANNDSASDERSLYYGLRNRLLWFTTTLYSYVTNVVIQSELLQLEQALNEAEDVDCMIKAHDTHVERLADQALLGARLEPIHASIITILDLSIQLCDLRTSHASWQVQRDRPEDLRERMLARPTHRGKGTEPDWIDEESASDVDSGGTSSDAGVKSYVDRLRGLRSQFDHLCKFTAAGLRGVARAGGEPKWGLLAETLENGIGSPV